MFTFFAALPEVEKSVLPVPKSLSNLRISSTASTCSSASSSASSGYASFEEDTIGTFYVPHDIKESQLTKTEREKVTNWNTGDEFISVKGKLDPLGTIAESPDNLKEHTKYAYSQRPLHRAAIDGNLRKVRSFIEGGLDVNDRDKWNKTPLHYAAQYDNFDVLRSLIISGANIEALDDHQQTPLHYAARRGNARTVQFLLVWGANPQAVDKRGLTAVDLAHDSLPWFNELVKYHLLAKTEANKLARKRAEERDKKFEIKEYESDQRKQIRSELQFEGKKNQMEAHATKEKITPVKGSVLSLCKASKPDPVS